MEETKKQRKTRSDKGVKRVSRDYHVFSFRMDMDIYNWVVANKGDKSIMRFISDIIREKMSE